MLRLKSRPAGSNEFANRSRETSAIRGRSETRENWRMGRERRATECAGTNAIGFQFLCCRWKDSVTLGTSGLACQRVHYAQQASREDWIAREGKGSAREHRNQHCDRKRANNRARNRARDGGGHYRSATGSKR